MMITPQARRRITVATGTLTDPEEKDRWQAWASAAAANVVRTEVPFDIAEIALRALIGAEREIYQQLGRREIDEDTQADLLNDLGYVQAIGTAIRNEGVGR